MRTRKISAALLLSVTMGLSLLSGCGSNTAESTAADSGSSIYGVVKEVSDSSITIEEGTMKERSDNASGDQNGQAEGQTGDQTESQQGQPPQGGPGGSQDDQQGQPPQGQPPQGQKPDGQPPQGGSMDASDMLDLTGEEKTITVTDSTVVTSGHPDGGQADANGGQGQNDQNSDSQEAAGQAQDNQNSDSQEAASQDQDSQSSDSQEAAAGQAGQGNEVDEISDIQEGDVVAIELGADGNAETITVMNGGMQGGPGGMPGGGQGGQQSSAPSEYEAVTAYTEDTNVSDETYTSKGTDENAVLINDGASVTLENATVSRTSDDSTGGDSSSFYGVGAAVLNTEGTAYIKGGSVDTDAKGGAGIFSYGDQSITYVADTVISTKQDTSGGIHVAGGGTLYAWNVTAETQGESSAAIRSDRGGGTMVVDGGTFTSNGTGSPAVYTTADITVNDATLTATNSEAVCIEGLNSLRLYDTKLTGNMPESDQNDCTWNVILYQSMSGDSQEGNSTFDMEGGSLTAKNGGMFYTTNTESTFILNNVDITYADQNDFFLKCTGNSNARGWGSSGENGADCTFTGISQEMEGDIIWDSIGKLDFYMTEGSSLKGAVVDDESNAGSGADGYCNLVISKDSTWTVTGDSTLTSLSSEGQIVDEEGNTVTIQGSDGTVYVEGSSQYTVTVDNYSDSADLSGAGSASSYSDYQTAKPEALK